MSLEEMFQEFLSKECELYVSDDRNVIAISWQLLARNLFYLDEIYDRHIIAGKAVKADLADHLSWVKTGVIPENGKVTKEELKEKARNSHLLQLEIESYFIFSKIALDRLARLIENYFDKGREVSLDKHSKAVKNILEFAKQKSLSLPLGMHELMKTLETDVSEYRNDKFTHHKNQREMYGIAFRGDTFQISTSHWMPRDSDKSSTSTELEKVREMLSEYLRQVEKLICDHRSCSKFALKPEKS